MKHIKTLTVFSVSIILAAVIVTGLIACASKPKVKVEEMENKGTSMGVPTPDWIKNYTANGILSVQNQPQYKDKYCVVGEESGVNKQFVLTWADNFSAQQRIGAMLRTNIASEYQARVQGASKSTGGANSSSAQGAGSGEYNQQIDSVITAIVNVSYSGAQREADWWSLRRRYDPDQKGLYTDEYTAYVLYTIPKAELNRQIAHALETSVKADSALYAITIEMAKQILQSGMANWGKPEAGLPPPAEPKPVAAVAASSSGIQNGVYTYWPRLKTMKAGLPADNIFIPQITVTSDFIVIHFCRNAQGPFADEDWNTGISGFYDAKNFTLQNIDNASQFYSPVSAQYTNNGMGRIWTLSYDRFTAAKLKLSVKPYGEEPPYVFEDIVIGKPDK
jgi:hypothetical protein